MKFTLSVLFLLLHGVLLSQISPEFGAKAGLNYSCNRIVTDADGISDDNMFRTSYYAGFYTRLNVSSKIFFSPEILFSSKGYRFDRGVSVNNNNQEGAIQLNYLSLPLIVGFQPIKHFDIYIGPELSYRLSSKAKYDKETIDVGSTWNTDFDLGISFGVSSMILEKVSIELRYTHGFLSVIRDFLLTDEYGNPLDDKVSWQNRTLQLGIKYKLF